ncbi:AAA family ATPase [Salininema proteolyticum]|uniref:AAA family ATPase n=1 Tax=Salininema proteolyticum TaxID=1607685 RepID=A0ABV8U203_9ACTN
MTSIELIATRARAGLESRRGIVRIHPEVFTALGLQPGDAVTMSGTSTTSAIALEAEARSSRRSLHADDLVLGNLGIRENSPVAIGPADLAAADTVTVNAAANIMVGVDTETLRHALLSKVVTEGDDISLLPMEIGDNSLAGPTRRTLNNTLGMGWTSLLMSVVDTSPDGPVMITNDTLVQWDRPVERERRVDLPGRGVSVDLDRPRRTEPTITRGPAPGTRDLTDATPRSGTLSDATPSSPATRAIGAGGAASAGRGRGTDADPRLRDTVDAAELGSIPYGDLVGNRRPAEELHELLDLAFRHSEVLNVVGTSVRLGIVLTGPSGSGKSTIVRSIADDLGVSLFELNGPDLAAVDANSAASQLRSARDSMRGQGILLLRNVDAIVPDGTPTSLATMFTRLAEEVLAQGNAVVCTTTNVEKVGADLRSTLDHEVVVDMPDSRARTELIGYLTRGMRIGEDVDLAAVSAKAQGYVPADLAAVVREAGVRAALRAKDGGATALQTEDLETALGTVGPSALADDRVDLGGLTLADVGGMEDLKQSLTETVLWPLTYPDSFTRLGIEPPRGMLLYGPPGCGKTFIVRAVAGEGHANVVSIKGSELLNKWVGESERNVRDLFRRARTASPTLMFFDELDALAPVRGHGTDGGTADRVVASLLTELDGAEALHDVVVVGATNRPDMIDPALLRPGRMERLVYVPPPDAVGRADILRSSAKNVPFADDVDLDAVAEELWLYSAADCAALVREAALTAMRESLEASLVTMAHLESARERVRPSLDVQQLEYLEQFAEQRKQM